MVRNEYVANMYKSGAVFRILNKVYIFTDNLYCMVFSVNQHLLGRSNFNIKARYIKKLNIWVTCCRVWSKIQFYGFGTCYLMTMFWFMPWLFFWETHVQGSRFHSKNVDKSFSSRHSLNGHHALWTGEGGVVLDYIRQPCKGQGFLCHFGQ